MASRTILSRPELKRQRDALRRFQRYLPLLKLKQQLLQAALHETRGQLEALTAKRQALANRVAGYRSVFNDWAGADLTALSRVQETEIDRDNVAGVDLPRFRGARCVENHYSALSTSPWIDLALEDARRGAVLDVELDVLWERRLTLESEMRRALQRVNLFEKVKIPQCEEAIRRIRIHLGDALAAAVGRAKIAKAKMAEREVHD